MKGLSKKQEIIKALKEKLKNNNTPEVNKALELKLKMLEGGKPVMK